MSVVVLEDGTGTNPDADSYVDPAGAVAARVIASHYYSAGWTALSADDKATLCRMATRLLDQNMEWYGWQKTDEQPLAWPRSGLTVNCRTVTGLPILVARATIIFAMALAERNRAADPGGGGEQGIKSINLGNSALELEFDSDPSAGQPAGLFTNEVETMLREYGTSRAGRANGAQIRRLERG